MSHKVFAVLLTLTLSLIAVPVSAQTLTGSGSVTVSAVVSDSAGSPAQVLIPSMASVTMPNISANVTITNEGTEDYEYFYEWCVMADPSDFCGSGNNTYYASASKLIALGQNWNTTLTATVLSPGVYYFKTTVYFGSNASSAMYQFTATGSNNNNSGSSGGSGGSNGGGGSGGSVSSVPNVLLTSTPVLPALVTPTPRGDFNKSGKVDIVDFSILLSYWGAKPPFKNPLVDLNGDGKINSIDFSILLYLWGKKT